MITRIVERTYCNLEERPSLLLANINPTTDIRQNMSKIEEVIEIGHKKEVNIIIFPELSLTGYIWEAEDGEIWDHLLEGETHYLQPWFNNIRDSLSNNQQGLEYVFFNNVFQKGDDLFNSTFILHPDYDFTDHSLTYDKIFLPPLEKRYFKGGSDKRLTIDTRWGRFGFLTCYDLCFVELPRQYAFTDDVDAIVTVAAWRAHAIRDYPQMNVRTDNYYGFLWDLMNSSKAAYNQTWSIGVNQVGSHDRSGILFWGGGGVWAPSGLPLLQGSKMREELLIIRNLDIKEERARSEVEFNYRIDFENVYRKMKETKKDIKDLKPEKLPLENKNPVD